MEEAAETIKRNAERLIRDSKALAAIGSYRTAASLAVLALEECGKACLVHWVIGGLVDGTSLNPLTRHVDKQNLLLAFKATLGVFNGVADIVSNMDLPALEAFASGSLEPDDAFFEKVARTMWEHTWALDALINNTVINYAKNNGFYEDISSTLRVERVITCEKGWYNVLLYIAEEGLRMTSASPLGHKVMAVIYQQSLGRPAAKRASRNDVLEMVRYADAVVAQGCKDDTAGRS